MLKRLLDNTMTIVEERRLVKEAVALWSHGLPVGSPWYVKNEWPVLLWARLLKEQKIHIKPVDLNDPDIRCKIELLGYIHSTKFWNVLRTKVDAKDLRWEVWLNVAMEDGNIELLDMYPNLMTKDELLQAAWNPYSKQWVLNHAVYGKQESWLELWKPMSYEFHFNHYSQYRHKSDSFINLVKSNMRFEGTNTATNAFWEMRHMLDRSISDNAYEADLRGVWELSENSIPYDAIASVYGFVPSSDNVLPQLYKECIAIAYYGLSNHLWEASTQHPTHAEKTSLSVYLDIVQPGSRKEIIELLAEHFSLERGHVEEVSWRSSFEDARV